MAELFGKHLWIIQIISDLICFVDNAQDAKATLVTIDVIDDAEYVKMMSVQDNGEFE